MAFGRTISTLATSTILAALPALAGAQTLPTYHATELTSASGAACTATAINDAGVVAGTCGGNSGAVVWRNGQPTYLGLLAGGTFAGPAAINTLGVVAGAADANFSARTQAFVSTGASIANIDPISGGNAFAVGIMDNGVIFGNLTKSLSGGVAGWNVVMWTEDPGHPGRYKENFLPKYPGGDTKTSGVYAARSNKVGQVVGWVTNSVIGQLGGFWSNDAGHTVAALQALPGGYHSLAWSVNDLGQAVGESSTIDTPSRAVLWQNDSAHTVVDLGTLPGDNYSVASDVNSAGQVVGVSGLYAYPTVTGTRAFFYQNGQMVELAALIDPADGVFTLESVSAINNVGQILAGGTTNGRPVSIVLTPIQ